MKEIRIEKVTLNVGAGRDQKRLEKSLKLFETITKMKPTKTITNKKIPTWDLRPGLPIGCKVTIRNKEAEEILKSLLEAKDNQLKETQFDKRGNFSFGIHEYIDIPGIKYDPDIGIIGFEVCVTLTRPGYRISKRKVYRKKISEKHIIKKEEAIKYIQEKFNVKVE